MSFTISRRDFMGAAAGVGMLGMGMGMVGAAYADGTSGTLDDVEANLGADCPWCGPGSVSGDWNGTPEEVRAVGGCTMPLDELNRRRHMYVDAQTEYTCEDGTVIPAVYVKVRALINTYGSGVGCTVTDHSFDWIMQEMTEEQAQAFIDMPYGKRFTPIEFAVTSGREIEECEQICDHFFSGGWIGRVVNDSGTFYYHVPAVQGFVEYHTPEIYTGKTGIPEAVAINGSDLSLVRANVGTGSLLPAPCSRDVVKDGDIYPYDDLETIWSAKNKFSLSPCFCRFTAGVRAGTLDLPGYPDGDFDLSDIVSAECGDDVMTCMSSGEEAQFWIDHHVGREITKEEALERLRKSREDGFILEHTYSKECDTICSCKIHCCTVLKGWLKYGSTDVEMTRNWLRYTLEFTPDTCAKCGACAERCPMETITMDEETGYPVVGNYCLACGQCAYVCPTQSRWLVRKDDVRPPFAEDIHEADNLMAADRFERGLIW